MGRLIDVPGIVRVFDVYGVFVCLHRWTSELNSPVLPEAEIDEGQEVEFRSVI